jgi:cation-transporting P-type ATPase E
VVLGENSTSNKLLAQSKKPKKVLTPIQLEINVVIRFLFIIVTILSSLIVGSNVLKGIIPEDSIQATGVIIAIIPNSLFVMINLAYALGAVKMSKKNVLVQKLNAVESISNVDVLCFDKTGTLTANEIYLDSHFFVSNVEEGKNLIQTFVQFSTSSNKTFEALEQKYPKQHILQNNSLQLVNEVPFGSSHKWSGITLLDTQNNEQKTLIMGAFDVLDARFNFDTGINSMINDYIEQGSRVLCFISSTQQLVDSNTLPNTAKLEAVLVFKDKLREGVGAVLEQFHREKVQIKIISGDNPQAVQSLFKQVSFGTELANMEASFISGLDLAKMTPTEFDLAVQQNTIFGRITPDQKEQIVDSLKARGKFVAMTGDGVNDILSMKKSSLAIAMNSGSQATKQIADLVLLDDNLGSLLTVLQEGKRIKVSLQNIFELYLSRGLFLILIIIYSAIMGLPFPLNIRQSALLTIIATGFPSIGLTLWSSAENYTKKSIFKSILTFILPAGFAMSLIGLVLYLVLVIFENTYNFGQLAPQTGIVLFATICCLMLSNIIFTNRKMQILSVILLAFITILPLTDIGMLWKIDTARFLPILLSMGFALIWLPVFLFLKKYLFSYSTK